MEKFRKGKNSWQEKVRSFSHPPLMHQIQVNKTTQIEVDNCIYQRESCTRCKFKTGQQAQHGVS